MIHRIILLVLCAGAFSTLTAQSYGKLMKQADALFAAGNYAEAGSVYNAAWQKKKTKGEAIFKAGECYYLLRNYRKAAEAYGEVKDKNDDFPLVGLKYARSLKQDGQYDSAIQAFQAFAATYSGEGKAILEDIIRVEVDGCNLGKMLPGQPRAEISFAPLGSGVNSPDQEFAPIAMGADAIYYSSTTGGKAQIYESRLTGGAWSRGNIPANFPLIQNGQYCHGSLSPDGARFYFTICAADRPFGNLTSRCEIFVMRRSGTGWSQPVRLPDFINAEGVTATQPAVVHRGDVEILYFASNRPGGRGGMDLWYVTRSLRLDNSDFSQPVNMGPTVNTLGDEMTPFYDANDGVLYFSSNGHVSIGGLDIFRTQGDLSSWTVPENLGLPFNSSADDLYYVLQADGTGGFLSSNRIFAGEKLSTGDDDIFGFQLKPRAITLEGNVFSQESGEPLNGFTVTLFEQKDDGTEMLLLDRTFDGSSYQIEILPNRRFKVEIVAPGYSLASYSLFTDNPASFAYGQPVFLAKTDAVQPAPTPVPPTTTVPPVTTNPVPPATKPEPTPPVTPTPVENTGEMYTARGTASSDNGEYQTNAPRFDGVYYKVQVSAVAKFNAADSRYDALRSLGDVQTEFLTDRKLYRVLVGTFFSADEARKALSQVRAGNSPRAFIVKYENGVRYGRVNL